MGSIFFLAAVSLVLFIVIVVVALFFFSGQGEGRGTTQGDERRDEAIKKLHSARESMRAERPDLVRSAQRARADAMKMEIENASLSDPQKAADNLQKFMD